MSGKIRWVKDNKSCLKRTNKPEENEDMHILCLKAFHARQPIQALETRNAGLALWPTGPRHSSAPPVSTTSLPSLGARIAPMSFYSPHSWVSWDARHPCCPRRAVLLRFGTEILYRLHLHQMCASQHL